MLNPFLTHIATIWALWARQTGYSIRSNIFYYKFRPLLYLSAQSADFGVGTRLILERIVSLRFLAGTKVLLGLKLNGSELQAVSGSTTTSP